VTGAQLREIRTAIGCGIAELAREAGVSADTCRDAEATKAMRPATSQRYVLALSRIARSHAAARVRHRTEELLQLAVE
jgi:transcriptional regulator with XRE-family HTH domain